MILDCLTPPAGAAGAAAAAALRPVCCCRQPQPQPQAPPKQQLLVPACDLHTHTAAHMQRCSVSQRQSHRSDSDSDRLTFWCCGLHDTPASSSCCSAWWLVCRSRCKPVYIHTLLLCLLLLLLSDLCCCCRALRCARCRDLCCCWRGCALLLQPRKTVLTSGGCRQPGRGGRLLLRLHSPTHGPVRQARRRAGGWCECMRVLGVSHTPGPHAPPVLQWQQVPVLLQRPASCLANSAGCSSTAAVVAGVCHAACGQR